MMTRKAPHTTEARESVRLAFLAVAAVIDQLDATLRGLGYSPSGEAWWQELLDARRAIAAAYGDE